MPAKSIYQFDELPTTATDGAQVIALANNRLVRWKYEGSWSPLLLVVLSR
jgi:hypothetical protein